MIGNSQIGFSHMKPIVVFAKVVIIVTILALLGCSGTVKALKHYQEGIELLKRASAQGYEKQKNALIAEAVVEFSEAIRNDPRSDQFYSDRGYAYSLLGQHQLAMNDHDRAITSQSQVGSFYINRGLTYAAQDQHKRAIQDYDKATQLETGSSVPYHYRGLSYASLGQVIRAIEDYDMAIRLGPESPTIFNDRGLAYLSLGRDLSAIQDFGDEARVLTQNIDLKPSPPMYADRAKVYTRLGRDEDAKKDVARAVESGYDPATLESEIEEIRRQR